MAGPVHAGGRRKKRKSPVGPGKLYRELMGVYAALLRQGVAPRQIDETELEDLFVILDAMDSGGSPATACIDDVMKG